VMFKLISVPRKRALKKESHPSNQLKVYHDGTYIGALRNDQRNGWGIHCYKNGDRHEGYWKNDRREGLGIFLSGDGNKVVGFFREGEPKGLVVLRMIDGHCFIANWKRKEKTGLTSGIGISFGKKTCKKKEAYLRLGEIYTDGKEISNDELVPLNKQLGLECFSLPDDTLHICEPSKNHNMDGRGVRVDADGGIHIGEWTHGIPVGVRFFVGPNGNIFHGKFKKGACSHGTCYYRDGGKYTGSWKNHKWDGYGTYMSPTGDLFVGGWKAGKKHGFGTQNFENGDKEVRNFNNGKPVGLLIRSYKDGRKGIENWGGDKIELSATGELKGNEKNNVSFKNLSKASQGTCFAITRETRSFISILTGTPL